MKRILLKTVFLMIVFAGVSNAQEIPDNAKDLREAIEKGDTRAALNLIEKNKNLINGAGAGRKTFLMTAAEKGSPEIIDALISNGAKVDAADAQGRTALFYAVSNDEIYAVEKLLEKGANSNHAALAGVTPLIVAARSSFDLLIPILLKAGAKIDVQGGAEKMSPLMWAVKEADIETVEAILRGKPDLSLKNAGGRTIAAQLIHQNNFYDEEILKAILRSGANPNEIIEFNNYRLPFLHAAVASGRREFIIALLKAGADPYLEDAFESNAYDYSEMYKCFDCGKIIDENKLEKFKPGEKP